MDYRPGTYVLWSRLVKIRPECRGNVAFSQGFRIHRFRVEHGLRTVEELRRERLRTGLWRKQKQNQDFRTQRGHANVSSSGIISVWIRLFLVGREGKGRIQCRVAPLLRNVAYEPVVLDIALVHPREPDQAVETFVLAT